MDCSMPGLLVHHQLPEFTQTHVHWVGDTIQPPHPFSSCLQSFPESGSFPMSQFFTPGGKSIGFSISPSNEYSGLICFRIHWFDVLAVQGTLKSLLQNQFKSINSSMLSFLYTPTLTSIHDHWKTHNLDYYPKPSENMLLWVALNMLEEWSTKVLHQSGG